MEIDDIRSGEKVVSGKDSISAAKPQERDAGGIAPRAPVNMVDASAADRQLRLEGRQG
jgi:hypothetical protein